MKTLYIGILTVLFSVLSLDGFPQISRGGVPLSFRNTKILTGEVPVEVMPPVDVQLLLSQDSLNDGYKEIPWRFGWNIPVSYDLFNSGVWDILPNGDRLWRLGIKCPGGLSINLTFDRFWLPPGAKFYEYNADRTQVIGAFTDFNNRADSAFATTLIKGEEIILEYFEPRESSFPGRIHLNRVTHGYRDSFRYFSHLGFGDSDTCNHNVHCPKAAAWQNQVRSGCLTLVGGMAWCSGSLVNNTSQDGTPYILTAAHCYSDPSTWVFWFNWESPTCENPPAPPGYNSISGSSLIAKNDTTDFCLLKLSSVPPADFGVYYAGWNRNNIPATSAAMVHHPEGDIKKMSFTSLPLIDTVLGYYWEALWDDGSSQPGSSGAPLFDQHHLIVGIDHGGLGWCAQSRRWCLFGKFTLAWDYSSHPTARLKEWLDPTGIAGDTLHGWDPNAGPLVHTLAATNVEIDSATLNGTVNPNGLATMYHFDWGTTTDFGDSTTAQSAGSGSSTIPVSADIGGLEAWTHYFCRLVARISSATFYGDTLSFVTPSSSLNVIPPNQNVDTAAGLTKFLVLSNVTWTAASGSIWCAVTPTGTGTDTIFATFTENTSANSRVAQIIVQSTGILPQTVTVTQKGITPILNVTPPQCKVPSSQGSTTFTVSSNAEWNSVSDASWCTVTTGGSGNGTISADYSENTSSQQRIANISVTVTGLPVQTVSVTQDKAPSGISDPVVNAIIIHPNPCKGKFRIADATGNPGKMEIQVLDMVGRCIVKKELSGGKEYEIDLSPAEAGIYHIKITKGTDIVVKKLIISR